MQKIKVFVYGTLMKNRRNHHYLKEATFLGTAELENYEMYRVATYPGIVPKPGAQILGEVYEINSETLKLIDRLEAEGNLYIRTKEEVLLNEKKTEVFVYVWNKEIKGFEKVDKMPWQP